MNCRQLNAKLFTKQFPFLKRETDLDVFDHFAAVETLV